MLRSVKQLLGYDIVAVDGLLGRAQDLYFDDQTWRLRYLVANLEKCWLGQEVLISPDSMLEPHWSRRIVPVTLTVQQVMASPDVETDLPVSAQQEEKQARYYNWAPWWQGAGMPVVGLPISPTPIIQNATAQGSPGNPHLRSVNEVSRYRVRASDGKAGGMEGFLAEVDSWTIRYLVVCPRRWLSSRRVLISPASVARIDWHGRQVHLGVSRNSVKASREYHASTATSVGCEGDMHNCLGGPESWGGDPANASSGGESGGDWR